MKREILIKMCKELCNNNFIFFTYYKDNFRKSLLLKFYKDFKCFSVEFQYIEIENIKDINYFKNYILILFKQYGYIK